MYMEDLSKIDTLIPPKDLRVPPGVDVVTTPLRWSAWERELASHPDRKFRSYIVEGVREGFHVGFDYSVDIASAYRTVPVHPVDRMLLGMRWQGDLLVDGALPFGLRSAPKIFTAVADALLWVMGRHGVVHAMHYLDDFLILGPPNTRSCHQDLSTSLDLCDRLGDPIARHKLEGPSASLSFLGIQVDTVSGTLSLPPEKLARLVTLIQSWRGRKCCRKRELLSLIGQLQHACRVVRPGRTFLRRMIDLSSSVMGYDHWVRLNCGFRSDLRQWEEQWNGVALCKSLITRIGRASITSDASGRWG